MGADLVDMQLISKDDKGIRFLLCVSNIYSKSACDVSSKEKNYYKCNDFQRILDESGRKPNKRWVDKGSNFYNI